MKAATKPLGRQLRDLFRVEPLEARVLLSADPITGAAQIVLRPADDDGAALVAQAYQAGEGPDAGGTTLEAAPGDVQAPVLSEWLDLDAGALEDGNGAMAMRSAGFSAMAVNEPILLDEDITDVGDILLLEAVLVQGDRILTAGTDPSANEGLGALQLGEDTSDSLNGDGVAGDDTLVLRTPHDVYFTGPVGNADPLEGLTIEGVVVSGVEDRPENVMFTRAVRVNGDLVITASGTVTFNDRVEITGGGSLRIFGADNIVFRSGVTLTGVDGNGVAGDIFLEGNEISFGGAESVRGQGVLTLRPTDVGAGIELGTPPNSTSGGVLNISNDEIEAFYDGFSRIVIGHQDAGSGHATANAGTVRIGAINALDQATLRDPLEVYGGTIIVEDYSTNDYTFLVEGTMLLDARNDIVLRNKVEASVSGVATGISLYSHAGQVRQENATLDAVSSEPLRAGVLTVRAALGIDLGYVEVGTLSASNVTSGSISIVETAAGGNVEVASLEQVGTGALLLRTTAGNITVNGDVVHAGSGNTLLQARTAGGITVNQEIRSTAGSIALTAAGAIITNDGALTDGTIVAGGSAVTLESTAGAISQGGLVASGGLVSMNAFTTLTMADGVVARALDATDTGRVHLTAGGNVTVSIVEADGQVTIRAGGSILDGLAGDGANIDGETAAVLLAAAGSIGAGATPLQTRVQSLAASSTGTAGTGIFVREATALVLASQSFWAVEAHNGGAVVIVTTDGALTVAQGVRSVGTGNILLQSGETASATDAGLNVAGWISAGGSMSLISADGIVIDNLGAGASELTSGNGRTLDLQADDGITMEAEVLLSASAGRVRVSALDGDLVLGRVSAGSAGAVSLHASGAILQAAGSSGFNVLGNAVRMEAGGAIGTASAAVLVSVDTLAASAGGAAFLSESNDVIVGEVAVVSVERVGTLGTIASNPADAAAMSGLDVGGALVLAAAQNLTVQKDVLADGNLRLHADAVLTLAASAGSTGGSVTAIAGGSMSATAAGELYSEAGTVELQATAISLADGSLVRTDAGNIRVHATSGALTVGRIDARSDDDRDATTMLDAWGDVSLVAGTAIADNADETAIDIYARNLRLQAGAGIAAIDQALETEVTGVLAATSGAGALFLSEASQLAVGAVADFGVNAVGAGGVAVATAVGATASGVASGGALVLRTLDGALLLAAGGVTATGNLLLEAQGAGKGLTVDTAVSGGGHLSLLAAGDLLVSADISGTTSGRTIDLQAGGTLTQEQGTLIASTDANVALKATGAVVVESVTAGAGGVWISGASIADGDAGVDITAASAQLFATGAIGAAGAALETSVNKLTASASGGLYLAEANGLSVEQLQLNVERVNVAGGSSTTTRAAQQGLSAGTTVLTVALGDLTLAADTGAVSATGAMLLDAAGAITANAQVSASSHLSVVGASIVQAAAGDFLAGGTLDVEARNGVITMADGAVARTTGGNIRYAATGAITVGQLDARSVGAQSTWGAVSIRSDAGIQDNAETDIDVYASDLRLKAATGIATGAQQLETEALGLSAAGGTGGVYLAEASALAIATTASISVNRVGLDGSTLTAQTDAAQVGVTAGTQAVVTTATGTLAVSQAVTAAGNLLLAAGGSGDVNLTAAVTSTGGDLSLQAGASLLLSANVYAGGAGKSIDMVAGAAITQAQDKLVSTLSGNVSLAAVGNVTLEQVVAGGTGTAIRISAGAIVDGDAALDTEVDLVADSIQLVATGAIGAAGAQLETTTGTLAVDADGDVFLNNTGALVFGGTTVSVARVGTQGATTAVEASLTGLGGDDVVVRTLAGGITTNTGATVATTGNLRLDAVGTITLNAATSAMGSISMVAGGQFQLRSSLATSVDGSTIDVQADLINAAQGSSIVAANANVQLQSANSVTLELIQAGTGNVRISGSSLGDGDSGVGETEVDIFAAGLAIAMTGGVGTLANALEVSVDRLTVSSGNAAVSIVESTGLVLGSVDTFVKRVDIAGVATATTATSQSNVSGTTVVVRTLAGSLESLASGAVSATGNILLRAAGTGADLTLGAAVNTSNGNVSIEAERHLLQNASVTSNVSAGSKTMDLRAGGDLTQLQGVTTSTINGNVQLTAGGTLTLEGVSAGAGQVGLFGASIVDGDADFDVEVDVLASAVRFEATGGAIGTSTNALETSTSRLSVTATGDVFVTETDGVSLEGVSVAITRVLATGADATSAAVQAAALGGDDIVVRTVAGALQVQANGAITATGNVLLQAAGIASDLTLGGAVTSAGHVSLAAGHDLLLNANIRATGATGTIDLLAGRDLTQGQGTSVAGAGGNIALQASGAATIELVNAGSGAVRIAAATVIDGDIGANETEVDVLADALLLQVSTSTGTSTNALETTIAGLAVAGGGNLFLAETNALATRSVTVNVERVSASAGLTTTTNDAVAGLASGTTVVRTVAGALTIEAGAVHATGNLLLQAGGSATLAVQDAVSGAAHMTLKSGGDLVQAASVSATSSAHTLHLEAVGSITQEQGAVASSNGGLLSLQAGGDVMLARLQAGTGTVRIAGANVVEVGGTDDTDVDVQARTLQLQTSGAVGMAGNAIETEVVLLAANTGGALFVDEADALVLGASSITLSRVTTDGTASTGTALAVAGVRGGAAAVVRTLAGALTVDADVEVLGNLLLRAVGNGTDLILDADVTSTGGHVSLDAARDLQLNADVATTASGATIDLLAGEDITQAADTRIASTDGDIALEAGGVATIESLVAGTGGVRVSAASIVDGDATEDVEADITAAWALLQATGAIGAAGADLETEVGNLSAHAGGDIFLLEADGVAIETVTVDVRRVGADGVDAATAQAVQAGLDGNNVVLRTAAGSVGSSASGTVVAAGNLLLQAAGIASNLALTGTTTVAGNLSLEATGAITLTSRVTTTGSGSTIDVVAGTSLTATQDSLIETTDGNVLLRALGGDVTLDRVTAGSGVVRITGTNLVDGDAAGDTEEDIAAAQLLVTLTGSMGSAANAIETGVGLLSVAAGGTVTVTASDVLALGSVTAAEVNRVGADGVTVAVAALTQSGVTATGLVTLLAQGDVSMAPGTVVQTQGDSDIVVTSRTGSILMDPTTGVLRTGSGDIRLTAEIDIRPGALITTGFAFLDARDGRVLIQGDLQRDGEDIDIFANDVTIEEVVSSPGGTLRIGPLELVPMIIGGPTPAGAALHLDVAELALLQDGFARIVLGSNLAGQVIEFRGTAAPLVFRDPLVVNATGARGTVLVTGQLRGDTITFQNAGGATTFHAATLSLQRTLLLEDQLVVRDGNTILAAQGGSGSLRFMQAVTGYGGSADKLTLDANGGDVRFDQAVSKLDGLAIRDADDVSFYGAVSVSGDLVIQATGTVTFKGPLTLTNGGRLIVTGGGKVVFGSTANLGSGDHLLKVSAVTAKGGTGSIRGTGELEIRGPSDATAIHIGSGAPRGALAIGDTFLRAIGKGFDALQIGNGSAKVTIGATDLRSTASPVVVDGKTIVLKGTGNGVRLGTDLTLHASGSITTSGKIVASKASDVVIDSDKGSVSMAKGSSIRTLGGDVSLEAKTGLKVADIDARAKKGAAGMVVLESTKGSITDANRDKAIDIYASGLTIKGLGPKLGAGDVLEVAARVVRITPPSGSVLRESGTDGRSHFSVLQGRNLYQAMVVVGPVTRITTSVETYLSRMSSSELAFSSGQAIKRGTQVDYWSENINL